jgi:hypothetical protein
MAYHHLDINPNTPATVKHFIRRHVDMLFHDVHCMLRLPMPAQDLRASCNFAAATFLLDLISGLSTALYSGPGGSGAHFKGVLDGYYPWEMEPAGGVDAKTGPAALYKIFRNPLVHALGLGKDRVAIGKSGLPEDLIEKLELSATRPTIGSAAATIMLCPAENRMDLLVDGLYWGVRVMIRRLTDDHALMAKVAKELP